MLDAKIVCCCVVHVSINICFKKKKEKKSQHVLDAFINMRTKRYL